MNVNDTIKLLGELGDLASDGDAKAALQEAGAALVALTTPQVTQQQSASRGMGLGGSGGSDDEGM